MPKSQSLKQSKEITKSNVDIEIENKKNFVKPDISRKTDTKASNVLTILSLNNPNLNMFRFSEL